MKRATCDRCGHQTGYLTIPTCTPCLRELMRIMRGKKP